ncbi:MAG TPA: hypothetical protein DCS93_27415 [Microscillaceae bacterium]|nr:hypothetical protein [Microscillaceae bacterium]
MAKEKMGLEQRLDSLYKSRQILMDRIDKKSLQIKNTYTRGILFLVAFSALIFFRDFKPSAWADSYRSFANWEKKYDKGLLKGVSYRDFLNSQDSVTQLNRYRILQLMDTSASDNSPMLTYYQQPKQGILLDSLSVISKQIENLLAYQKVMVKDSADLQKFAQDSLAVEKKFAGLIVNDTAQTSPVNDSLLRVKKKQLDKIDTDADGIRLDLRTKDSLSVALLQKIVKEYPPIAVWADPNKSTSEQIGLIKEEFDEYTQDSTITPWLAIDKTAKEWQWKYKTWKALNRKVVPMGQTPKKDTTSTKDSTAKKDTTTHKMIEILADWEKIFKSLKEKDQTKIKQEIIKNDSLFDYNKKELKKHITTEKGKQDQLQVPTAQISSTKIPLPLKHILLILPLIYAGMVLLIQLQHLKRSTFEIRTVYVEQQIEDYTGEEFSRTDVFGDQREIGARKGNWHYVRRFDFTRLFKNNPTYYKDFFFIGVSFLFFIYLMYKWGTLLIYNPNLRGWGWGIALLSLIGYILFQVSYQRASRNVLKKERDEYITEEQEKREEKFGLNLGDQDMLNE